MTKSTSVARDTTVEITAIRQGASGNLYITAVRRGTSASVELDIELGRDGERGRIGESLSALLVDAWTQLEEVWFEAFEERQASHEQVFARVAAAERAKIDAKQAQEEAERAMVDARAAAEMAARIDAETVQRRAALIELDADFAEKQKAATDSLAEAQTAIDKVRTETAAALVVREEAAASRLAEEHRRTKVAQQLAQMERDLAARTAREATLAAQIAEMEETLAAKAAAASVVLGGRGDAGSSEPILPLTAEAAGKSKGKP